MKIIGVSGRMGCGKSTFAQYLKELLGEGWIVMNFGDVLKKEVAERFQFPLEWCYSEEGKTSNVILPIWVMVEDKMIPTPLGTDRMTVRALLQWWGTDIMRTMYPGHWVKEMEKSIARLNIDAPRYSGVVIGDVRFPDELEICDLKIRLEAYPGYELLAGHDHPSETALAHLKPREWDWFCQPPYGALQAEAIACFATLVGELK